MRPGIIKVLSFHPPNDIAKLRDANPDAHWIIRAFLSFGGRNVTPAQFVEWTLSDTQRTIGILAAKSLVLELHNEPNTNLEGLGASWADGTAFNGWWLEVLAQFRAALPGVRIIYPGLSPGGSFDGVRQSHVDFIEQSRGAVEAADGLGVHLYWSHDYPMSSTLGVLDDYIARFPGKPIWVTEASFNRDGISDEDRARQYITFRNELAGRAAVEGVTFYVASASNPIFSAETWVGKQIAPVIGQR